MRNLIFVLLVVGLVGVTLTVAGGCGPHDTLNDPDTAVVEELVHAMASALRTGNADAYTRLLRSDFELTAYHPAQVFVDRTFFSYEFADVEVSRFHDTIQVSCTETFCHLKQGMSGREDVRRFVHMSWDKGDDLQWRLVTRTPDEISSTALDVGAPPPPTAPGPACP